jgi:SPP1 gp7 family putative phage head morphogenesis protein
MAISDITLGLARAAITAVTSLIDVAVRILTGRWAAAWDELEPRFTTAVEDLIGDAEEWPSRRDVERDAALQEALSAAAQLLDALAGLAAAEISAVAQAAVEQAPTDQVEQIVSQLPPGLDPGTVTSMVGGPGGFHQQAIDAIDKRVTQRITVLARPLGRDADMAMRFELVRGVKRGRNPRETARAMVDRVEGAFNGGLTRALTIARTETLDAYRLAAAATEDAHRDVLAGWTWLAKLDSRTCVACWTMHGTEHSLDVPGPQGHPQCRCARAPKALSWAALGFDIDEPEDAIEDAQAAFQALPDDEQLQIMGPARLARLNSGAVAWADLARLKQNPGWRPSYVTTPVRDLPVAG